MKVKSVIEVVTVFLVMKLFSIWFDSVLVGAGIGAEWRTFLFGAQAIAIPVAILALTKRNWMEYGFWVQNKKLLIHLGFVGSILMLLLGGGFGFLKSQGMSSSGRTGSLLLSGVALVMITLFCLAARRSDQKKSSGRSKKTVVIVQLTILAAMALAPVIAAAVKGVNLPGIIAWDLYFLIMVGFGEEIKYRGYFQSRINEEYGRPWTLFGISFGPGILIVSGLFGLSHMMQFGVFNPFLGLYSINPWMGVQAFFGGVFFGLIREKSKSIVSPGIAHGIPNAFGQVLAKALS